MAPEDKPADEEQDIEGMKAFWDAMDAMDAMLDEDDPDPMDYETDNNFNYDANDGTEGGG